MRRHPELDPGVRRTLERRIRVWRAEHGPDQDVIFRQKHEPGRQGLSDFTHLLTLPRGRAGATGPNVHVVNYRHVIHSLKKKPMALLHLVYRDALFPREPYRRCFEKALERVSERQACRLAVALLALAHEENCEADLAHAIDRALNAGRLPDLDKLKARFAPRPGRMPSVRIARPLLAGYGTLLDAGGAA